MQPSNLLKIESLGEGWCDKDHVLLHACFQLLVDFVEKEMLPQDYPDWDATPQNKSARKEIEALYAWWLEWKQEGSPKTSCFREDEKLYYKENQMLKRLVDIRMYMWT